MSEWKPEWINGVYSGDAGERAAAATEIFAAGRDRAIGATQAWWKNAELRKLLGEEPQVTVGVAVHPETFARIRRASGMPPLAEVPPEQDAREFELYFAGEIALDVLTTREPGGTGAIARFLAKQGEGIQQVEYRCRDVDRAAAILKKDFSIAAVYPVKRPGADRTWVNFFLVAGADNMKVLIELYEKNSAI